MTSNLFASPTLIWFSCDPTGLFNAATRSIIPRLLPTEVKLQFNRFDRIEQLDQAMDDSAAIVHDCGMVTLVIVDVRDVGVACRLLSKLKRGASAASTRRICVCFVPTTLEESAGLLMEAGAQIVVSQLPSWQQALPSLLKKVPLCYSGTHPLTKGLVDRLPWPA